MENNSKNLVQNLTVWIYAIVLIALLSPFFLWEGYRGGIFSSLGIPVAKILYILSTIIGIIYLLFHNLVQRNSFCIFLFLLANLIIIEFICGSKFNDLSNVTLTAVLNFLLVGLFCMFPNDVKARIYNVFLLLFAISISPGIIYSLFTFMRINLPYEVLTAASEIKQTSDVVYLHFPFAVQITKSYDLLGNLNRFRLCGIYDEPGRVGTVCALFLTCENLNFKKNWKNLLLTVGGILSLSLYFFLIIGMVYVIKLFKEKKAKQLVALMGLFLVFIIFLNINFDNVAITYFQNRFTTASTGIIRDNRTNSDFDEIFFDFLEKSNLNTLLLGNGDGSMYKMLTEKGIRYGSSYKVIIYDIGIAGTGLYLLWLFAYAGIYIKEQKNMRLFIIITIMVFILNLYQRPSIYHPSYLLIPLGGIVKELMVCKKRTIA